MQKAAAEKTLDYIFTSSAAAAAVSRTHASVGAISRWAFRLFRSAAAAGKSEREEGEFGNVNQEAIHLPVIDEKNAKERENGISSRKEIISNDFQKSFLLCTAEEGARDVPLCIKRS